jgi:cell fate (sporulation/competence/biofilm development) regulator YmcA (YheA/YmcA/DUF963 family)
MEPQTIINLVAGSVLMVVGWLARELWVAVKELSADLHKIEIELPTHYMRRDEFAEGMKEIKDMLRMIFDKLDGKVDKSWPKGGVE